MKVQEILRSFHKEKSISLRPAEFARIIERLDAVERLKILQRIPIDELIEIIPELSNKTKSLFFSFISPKQSARILSLLPIDERVDIIQILPPNKRFKIIEKLDERVRKETLHLLRYDPFTAGGLMTTDFIAFKGSTKVRDVINFIRSRKKRHYIYYVYVVDNIGKLIGVVSLRDLLLSKYNEKLENVMERDIVKAFHSTPAQEVVRIIKDNNLMALPVVDKEGKLLGIVTADDAMEAMESEVAREMNRMAGISPLENVVGAKVTSLAKARLPALLLGLLGTFLMVYVVSFFETTLQKYLPLAFFIPLLVYISDATGTQAESMTIRAIALDPSLPLSKYILKQLKSGIILSMLVAIICFLIAYLVWGVRFGVAIGLSLFISMNSSNLIASLLPIVYKRVLKVDPAGVSGPLDTILSDISTLIVYFLVASLMI